MVSTQATLTSWFLLIYIFGIVSSCLWRVWIYGVWIVHMPMSAVLCFFQGGRGQWMFFSFSLHITPVRQPLSEPWARMTASNLPWVFSSTLSNVVLADMHKTIEADVGIHAQIFRLAQSGNELTLSHSHSEVQAFLHFLVLLFSTSVFFHLSFIGLNQCS